MFAEGNVIATIAVEKLDEGKQFYQGMLGLQQISESPAGITYQCGTGRLFIYQALTSGTNQATSATWEVADVDGTVAELQSKGISFEEYDMPGATLEGVVSVMGTMRAAWFKDPDGNTLAIVNVS